MKEANRANIEFVFADDNSQFRVGLRNALMHEGYKDISDCSSLMKVEECFQTGAPDLLLIDVQMEGGAGFDTISKIRRSEIGKNPFITIMVTLWEPDGDLVRKVIESGVDDILLKPISTGQLMQRIEQLANERQKFVVTADYIGPQRRKDREKDDSEDGLKLDLVEVPNTLGSKARGEEVDNYELQKLISEAQTEINEQRLKRNAPEIAMLVKEIVPAFQDGNVDDVIKAKVKSLSGFAADVSERLSGTSYMNVSDLCAILGSIASALQHENPNPKNIALLTPLSEAISVSFNPTEESSGLADQVVALVRQYIEKNAADFARLE